MDTRANHPDTDGFRVSLELSPEFANQLRAVEAHFGPALASAFAPYQARFSLTGRAVDIVGDEPAVILIQRMIESAGEKLANGIGQPDVWSPAAIQSVLKETLERDLAFRVPGLRAAVRPKSVMQHAFMEALLSPEPAIVIGAGATGSGKTHLALAAGINLLEQGKYRHLIVTRPHVPASDEVMTAHTRADTTYDDQFAAIEDELNDLVGPDEVRKLQTARRLEIMPLGRMRGRTFNKSFILIDEAQNMNVRKTRMAVTRLGRQSKIVLTGNPSDVELKDEGQSGFEHLIGMVEGKGMARIFRFSQRQIVRNPVVAELEALYDTEMSDTPFRR